MKYLLPIAFALLMTSCLEKPTLSEEKGPEAAASQVFQAVATAWGDVDPSTIRQGEFSYKERVQTVQGGTPYVLLQEGVTVDSRSVDHQEKKVNYVFLQQLVEKVDGEPTSSTTSYSLSTNLPEEAVEPSSKMIKAQDVKIQNLVFGVDIIASLAYACVATDGLRTECQNAGADSCQLSCHNLKVSEKTVPAPDLVQQRENCGGLPDCKMKLKTVSFDQVLDIKRGQSLEQQKVTYTAIISPDAPYLSRLMNFCSRGVVQVPNSSHQVLVTVCNEVKDFRIGQPYCDKVGGCPNSTSSVE